MVSPGRIASSLLGLAAISSAQLITVTRTSVTPEPTTTGPPEAALASSTSTSTTTSATSTVLSMPTMWNLDSANPDCAAPPVSYLELDRAGSRSIEQAIAFRGIPPAARLCALLWRQAGAAERGRFEVGAHGRTRARQLAGFPAAGEPVTYNSLLAYDVGGGENAPAATFSPDFTDWPPYAGPFDHLAGAVPCSPEIYVRIALNADEGDGFVRLDQDERNGFYISYTL